MDKHDLAEQEYQNQQAEEVYEGRVKSYRPSRLIKPKLKEQSLDSHCVKCGEVFSWAIAKVNNGRCLVCGPLSEPKPSLREQIIDEQEQLAVSLVGKYPFKDVQDIIKEACYHQAEHTAGLFLSWLKEQQAEGNVKHPLFPMPVGWNNTLGRLIKLLEAQGK